MAKQDLHVVEITHLHNIKTMAQRPEKSAIVLLLVDVVNDFSFEGADKLLRFAIPAAQRIAALKKRAVAKGIPVVYVNDNFGHWYSSLDEQVEHCRQSNTNSKCIVELLLPEDNDYFVAKAKHSGFFGSMLQPLLEHLEAKTLILAGFATNICILFTANDAYMRNYELIVPRDCVAANTEELHNQALVQMAEINKAKIQLLTELAL